MEKREFCVYFVATPIGNMAEMTPRAVEVLSAADIIYCEDTRTSLPLLLHFGIKKPLRSHHKFNEQETLAEILAEAAAGKKIAVISDAGMPAISDPGAALINALIMRGVSYTVVSGATAFASAFVLSGFSAPFVFAGFLPEKAAERGELIERLGTRLTLIFYVAAHDLGRDLEFLHRTLGERKICLVREISKLFESVEFGVLGAFEPKEKRGECVLLVEGERGNVRSPLCSLSEAEHVEFYTKRGVKFMDAVKTAARERGMTKSELYARLMKEKKDS